MKNFEMVITDIFNLTDNRMVFVGHFVQKEIDLPMDATVYINNKPIAEVRLITIPISAGPNVNRSLDNIEAAKQVKLPPIDWEKDKV